MVFFCYSKTNCCLYYYYYVVFLLTVYIILYLLHIFWLTRPGTHSPTSSVYILSLRTRRAQISVRCGFFDNHNIENNSPGITWAFVMRCDAGRVQCHLILVHINMHMIGPISINFTEQAPFIHAWRHAL